MTDRNQLIGAELSRWIHGTEIARGTVDRFGTTLVVTADTIRGESVFTLLRGFGIGDGAGVSVDLQGGTVADLAGALIAAATEPGTEQPAAIEPDPVQEALKAMGFEEWHTGGGCMAQALFLSNGVHILCTEDGGTELPSKDGWTLGVYDEGENCAGISFEPADFPNFEAALVAAIAKAQELEKLPRLWFVAVIGTLYGLDAEGNHVCPSNDHVQTFTNEEKQAHKLPDGCHWVEFTS